MEERTSSSGADQEFVIARAFNAPRELVWRAWTEREQLMQWFGPQGYTMFYARLDLHPGGLFHYALRSPDGHEMWGKWTFREIVAPERLILVSSFSDAQGGLTRHPMSPNWPLETLSTITFEDQGGSTMITICWAPLNATEAECKTFAEAHSGMRQGWGGTFERLDAYLAKVSA